METKIDNSTVSINWQQITNIIDQLDQLKNSEQSVSDLIQLSNHLNRLLIHYSVQYNNVSNISASKRVSVVMPSTYSLHSNITMIPNQEKKVMDEEIKELGTPVDFQEQEKRTDEIPVVNTGATVEEPVIDSISKIKEMENVSEEQLQNNEESSIDIQKEEPNFIEAQKAEEPEKEIKATAEVPNHKKEEEEVSTKQPVETPNINEEATDIPPIPNVAMGKEEAKSNKQFSIWEAYSSNDIPTLAQQQNQAKQNDLNSGSFVQEKVDYSNISAATAIKDLRKAISISDRFLFLNELFRGEETEYERSIKTINGFNVYQEAKYWIDRELKLKLGWDDKNPVVKQFLNLVQRRFA